MMEGLETETAWEGDKERERWWDGQDIFREKQNEGEIDGDKDDNSRRESSRRRRKEESEEGGEEEWVYLMPVLKWSG
jgi:hypothetical protein